LNVTALDAAIALAAPFPYAYRKAEGNASMREPILITRYGGIRLYDPARARYVTVDELREWHARGIVFKVRDAETGEDVSCVLLA